jgi:hypothetical protein
VLEDFLLARRRQLRALSIKFNWKDLSESDDDSAVRDFSACLNHNLLAAEPPAAALRRDMRRDFHIPSLHLEFQRSQSRSTTRFLICHPLRAFPHRPEPRHDLRVYGPPAGPRSSSSGPARQLPAVLPRGQLGP